MRKSLAALLAIAGRSAALAPAIIVLAVLAVAVAMGHPAMYYD
jgi:hypothetical protein